MAAISYFLPTWTLWPASVERGFQLVGQYSYWLDPWIPMRDFWEVISYVTLYVLGILFAFIFSRSLRLKIFKR